MEEFERKTLLERIGREGATLGAAIPESIVVQDEEIDLREWVFEIKRLDRVPDGMREEVEQAKRNLRRERLQRKQRIERNEVSFEEGERLAASIIGIDRALEALESLRGGSIEAEAQASQAADQKRWMKFLRQALGRESSSRRGGR